MGKTGKRSAMLLAMAVLLASQAAMAEKIVSIGFSGPLTGLSSASGTSMLNAANEFYGRARGSSEEDIHDFSDKYSEEFVRKRKEAWRAFDHFCVSARLQMRYKRFFAPREKVVWSHEVSVTRDREQFREVRVEILRKGKVEILRKGKVLAHSDWQPVAPGDKVVAEVILTAKPGTYDVRQATKNVGDDDHETIAFQSLKGLWHPPVG